MTSRPELRAVRQSRKEAIVAAAAEVLRTQGVAGCTVRNIAEAGQISKSAIHYYFTELDDIVDLAFEQLLTQFITRIEAAAQAVDDPYAAVWAAAEEYLRLGSDVPGTDRAPMLAFDYHVSATRRGDSSSMVSLTQQFATLLERLVAATDTERPAEVADTLFSALLGTVVRAPLDARDQRQVLEVLSRTLNLPLRDPAAAH